MIFAGLLATGQIVVWTLAPCLAHSALPLDVVEGYLWGHEWLVGTYKHPALPSWVLEASRLATGTIGWPSYLVAQLFVATTYIFVFLLGRDLLGAERSAAGTLLLVGVAYYAWPTLTFDHNTAQLPFWTGLPWALWRAFERRALGWWLLTAALAAGALYAKLSSGLLLVSAVAWLLWDPRARQSLGTPGPWIALCLFAALVIPLGHWLVATDFSALKYAALRAFRAPGDGVHFFLANVAINVIGVPIMLAFAGLVGRRPHSEPEVLAPLTPVDPRALSYLVIITVVPFALAVIAALLTDSNLRAAWGAPMFGLVGLIAIALTSHRFDERALRRLAYLAAIILAVLPIGYMLVITFWNPSSRAPLRVRWPQTEIAERMSRIWAQQTGRPLRIVGGEPWLAGLIALAAREKPIVLGDGRSAPGRDLQRAQLESEGMLIVWTSSNLQPPLSLLANESLMREERFTWHSFSARRDLILKYVIVPPACPATPCATHFE